LGGLEVAHYITGSSSPGIPFLLFRVLEQSMVSNWKDFGGG